MRAPLAAFEKVYRRELPFVWAAVRRLGVPPAAIDDAVQDVFLTAHRRWGDLHHDVSPRAWLYGVTRRVAFRYRRSHARAVRRKAAVARDVEGKVTSPHRERDEARDVDAVLAALEPSRREVFVMAELLEMSGPEIAAQLEIPLNTVYSRLRLARRELEPRLRLGVEAWAGKVRERERPSAEQAQRTWAVLAATVGPGPAGAGVLGAWTAGRTAAVVAAIGVMTVAVVAAPERARERRERAAETVAEGNAVPGMGRGSRAAVVETIAASEEPTQVLAGNEVVVVEVVEPRETERSRRASARAGPRSSGIEAEGAEPATVSERSTAPGLEDEVAVLDRAAAALRDGDAAHALQWLAEHERQFPAGRLLDVRKATRVRALCRLGREEQAQTEAAALRREHPGSSVARRTPLECGKT